MKYSFIFIIILSSCLTISCSRLAYNQYGCKPTIYDNGLIVGSSVGLFTKIKELPKDYDYLPMQHYGYNCYYPIVEHLLPNVYFYKNGIKENLQNRILYSIGVQKGEKKDDEYTIEEEGVWSSDIPEPLGPEYSVSKTRPRTSVEYTLSPPLGYCFKDDISKIVIDSYFNNGTETENNSDEKIDTLKIKYVYPNTLTNDDYYKIFSWEVNFPCINVGDHIIASSRHTIKLSVLDYLSRTPINSSNLIIKMSISNLPSFRDIQHEVFKINKQDEIDRLVALSTKKYLTYTDYLRNDLFEKLKNEYFINGNEYSTSPTTIEIARNGKNFKYLINNSKEFSQNTLSLPIFEIPKTITEYLVDLNVSADGYYFYEGKVRLISGQKEITILLMDTGSKIRLQDGDKPNSVGQQIIIK